MTRSRCSRSQTMSRLPRTRTAPSRRCGSLAACRRGGVSAWRRGGVAGWRRGGVAVRRCAHALDFAAVIDAHVEAGPAFHHGLRVGQSLTLAVVRRACHATSKRDFAPRAATTTLNALVKVDGTCLTSQHV